MAIRPARFAAIMKAHFDAVRRYVLVRFLLGATSQLIVFAGLVLAVLIPLVTLQGEAASVENFVIVNMYILQSRSFLNGIHIKAEAVTREGACAS